MKKTLFILLALFVLGGSKLFNAHEYVLDNGLRVLVVENNKAPIIKQMLWYNAGASDENLSAKGTAHFLEHLMFRGSDYNAITEKNGIDINAFTSQDYTAYHAFMDISKLELAMYLEAKRMRGLSFSNEEFSVEKDVVFQERKQVIENNPISKFYEAFNKSFWQLNPYSHPITGEGDDIIGIQKQDIQEFYNNYYHPNNAVLVLAGNIKPEQAYKLAQKYFGNIKKGDVINQKQYTPDYIQNGKFEMNIPNINTPRFTKRFVAQKNSYALEVFAKYLADGKTSYLYKKMVEDDKSALSVSANYNGMAKYGASFSISITPTKSFDIDKLIKNALYNLNEDKLKQTKQKMTSGLVFLKDNPEDEAYILGALAISGMSLEQIENYENSINSVSLAEIKDAVNKMLSSSSLQGEVK